MTLTAHGRHHGTRSGYVAGCRCAECRTANAAYMTGWRHDTGRTDPARANPPAHGPTRYRRGCRCDVCRAANTAAVARARARRRARES